MVRTQLFGALIVTTLIWLVATNVVHYVMALALGR